MLPQVLKFYMKMFNISPAQLARDARVSRQAVSTWLNASPEKEINLQSKHLKGLAKVFNISVDKLLEPPLLLSNKSTMDATNALLNWDRLYPDLISFFVALSRNEVAAMARFVQVYGMFETSKMLGNIVWDEFPNYKKNIHPAVRKGLEGIWQLKMTPQ